MNVENFSYYLLDTSKLKEIGYQDLHDLIVKYPYCQNLHYLICKKSQIEEHPDFDKWLHLAATYSTDRAYLYQLLLDVDFEKDYTLETIDLDDLSKEIEEEKLRLPNPAPEIIVHGTREDAVISKTLAALQAQQANQSTSFSLELDDDNDLPFATFSSLLNESDDIVNNVELNETSQILEDHEGEIVVSLDEEEEVIENQEENSSNTQILNALEEKINEPLPKSAFNSYKAKIEVPSISDLPFSDEEEMAEHRRRIEEKLGSEQEKRKKRSEKKKKEQALISFADESLKDKEDTASETLATILALQGHKERAILMYEKLKLQIPEKSTFFAAQIEKLKIS